MSDHRVVYRSKGIEISTNIPGFAWPKSRDEKIDGLLAAGLIDEAEASRLRALPAAKDPTP